MSSDESKGAKLGDVLREGRDYEAELVESTGLKSRQIAMENAARDREDYQRTRRGKHG